MNKLEKVFKEFQTNLEKNKSNAEEVKRLF